MASGVVLTVVSVGGCICCCCPDTSDPKNKEITTKQTKPPYIKYDFIIICLSHPLLIYCTVIVAVACGDTLTVYLMNSIQRIELTSTNDNTALLVDE